MNRTNNACIVLSETSARAVVLCILAHIHGSLAPVHGTEPALMLVGHLLVYDKSKHFPRQIYFPFGTKLNTSTQKAWDEMTTTSQNRLEFKTELEEVKGGVSYQHTLLSPLVCFIVSSNIQVWYLSVYHQIWPAKMYVSLNKHLLKINFAFSNTGRLFHLFHRFLLMPKQWRNYILL